MSKTVSTNTYKTSKKFQKLRKRRYVKHVVRMELEDKQLIYKNAGLW